MLPINDLQLRMSLWRGTEEAGTVPRASQPPGATGIRLHYIRLAWHGTCQAIPGSAGHTFIISDSLYPTFCSSSRLLVHSFISPHPPLLLTVFLPFSFIFFPFFPLSGRMMHPSLPTAFWDQAESRESSAV